MTIKILHILLTALAAEIFDYLETKTRFKKYVFRTNVISLSASELFSNAIKIVVSERRKAESRLLKPDENRDMHYRLPIIVFYMYMFIK